MRFGPKAALGAAALAGVLALGTSAHALTSFTVGLEAKCTAGKIKTDGKGVAANTGCWSKAVGKALAIDPICLGKASTKTTGAFAKLDLKPPCYAYVDGPARDADGAAYAASVAAAVGPSSLATGKCDSAKIKLVGKYVAGVAGCFAKAAAKAPGLVDNAPLGCVDKNKTKLLAGTTKAELGLCGQSGQGAALLAAADTFIDGQGCLISASTAAPCVTCGNGLNDAGEKCDASAPSAGWASCGADFTCTACNCACPTKIKFTGTASAPESILDTGWTGISHRAPIVTDGTATITMACSATSRPCGTCPVSGPVANGPGELQSQRCTNDTSIHCTTNAPCTAGGGTCQFFFGSNLPLAAGGVTVCAVNQFNGSVTGTANVETGEAVTTALLTSRVYTGIAIDNPCARCVGDATINDGTKGGTCDGGTRAGLTCDGNGTVNNRPDFGTTSLDCPLSAGVLIATLPIDLSNATGPVTKTLSASSPSCTGVPTEKCLCDTCNNLAATPCDSNADCTAVGATICGGKRCLGGTNAGAPCAVTSECPGGGLCGRPGAATQASACLDDTSTVGVLDCTDTSPVDGEGQCSQGPIDNNCSVASGHAQRGCLGDGDCGGGGGSCVSANRNCFLTGGLSGVNGTNTLTAVGMADVPVADSSDPTIAAVFCVGPTGSAAVNGVSGLPGPGRATIKGAASGHP